MVALQNLCWRVQPILREEVVHVNDVENQGDNPVSDDRQCGLYECIGDPRRERLKGLEGVFGKRREVVGRDVCARHGAAAVR